MLPFRGEEPFDRLIVGVGYLGERLAARWKPQTELKIAGTTRSSQRFPKLEALGLQPVQWDVLGASETSSPSESLPPARVIVYCVGFDRKTAAEQHHSMSDVYVGGLERTLAALADPDQIERVVYISSTGVYGNAEEWVDESAEPAPQDDSGKVCLEAEQTLGRIATQRGFPYTILRLAGIYGPGRMIGAATIRQGEPVPSDPTAWVNLIEGEDAAAVTDAACRQQGAHHLFNVSDGCPVKRGEFYGYLASKLGAPQPVFDPSAARRHRGSRQISNKRMLAELAITLQYPDYRAGIDHTIATDPAFRESEA